jgi:hypothetical protein
MNHTGVWLTGRRRAAITRAEVLGVGLWSLGVVTGSLGVVTGSLGVGVLLRGELTA